MVKRVIFVMSLLFVFSLFFVSVSEAVEYYYIITKIGFYSSETDLPDNGTIVDLSEPVTVHQKFNEPSPNINEFVYQGNIANGTWSYIGLYVTETNQPNFSPAPPTWGRCPILNGPTTITDESRKLITISPRQNAGPAATITDL